MERGNLVIYDETGMIFSQTGEASGNINPHTYPVGIPWLEIPFGSVDYFKIKLVCVDVTTTPHTPVFEQLILEPTLQQQIEELENELLLAKGII